MKSTQFLLAVLILIAFTMSSAFAEDTTCKLYSTKELETIKESHNPSIITRAGIVELLINPESPNGKELLGMGSRLESPKGAATVAAIIIQMNWGPPTASLKEIIVQFSKTDKDNAFSYYLLALLKRSEGSDSDAFNKIRDGNSKKFNTYPGQRFDSIAQAAAMAHCSGTQSRQYAFWNSQSGTVYGKLRYLCQDLIKDYGPEAKAVCFAMGQKLERESLTFIEQFISLAIQSDAAPSANSHDQIKKKRDDVNACMDRTDQLNQITDAQITEDAEKEFCRIFISKGECLAREYLVNFIRATMNNKKPPVGDVFINDNRLVY
jgi:archaellin